MDRPVALRAFITFVTIAALSMIAGLSSHAAIAEATFLIGGCVAVMMLFLAAAARRREPALIPVRIRR